VNNVTPVITCLGGESGSALSRNTCSALAGLPDDRGWNPGRTCKFGSRLTALVYARVDFQGRL